jgi:hypothetical protein
LIAAATICFALTLLAFFVGMIAADAGLTVFSVFISIFIISLPRDWFGLWQSALPSLSI